MATKAAVNHHAAEASNAGHDVAAQSDLQAILHNPETWIIVAFVIFIAIFAKLVLPTILKGLDKRADTIRDQLEQASRLRAEAQALLASYQAQQEEMLKEAEAIVETAKRDAVLIRERAGEDLKQALERRTQQAQEKIARAELEAISHIRTRIIEEATETARGMITAQTSDAQDKEAVARVIKAIEQQIH